MRAYGGIVVAGPSGVGKSTLIHSALAKNDGWTFSISATTRDIRPHEEDGREYHFLNQEEFQQRILRGELLEYAHVYGNLYGTLASEFERAAEMGKRLIIEVDSVGCLSIKAQLPEIPLVAILPPGIDELKRRLIDRGTESEESIALRFANIVMELKRMRAFDFCVVNDEIEPAGQRLLNIMQVIEDGALDVEGKSDALLTRNEE